jgi:CxxC motif-containing protein (DUF1111 family)
MFPCVTGVCRRLGWVLLGAFALSAQAEEVSATADIDPREVYSGGAATTPIINEKAYSQFAPNLGFVEQGMFRRGDMLFRRTHEGLGPLFNAATCQSCHVRDGRGNPSPSVTASPAMLLRLGIPSDAGAAGVLPDPIYGDQLQIFALRDAEALHTQSSASPPDPAVQAGGEAVVSVTYDILYGQFPEGRDYGMATSDFADGRDYVLFQPVYRVRELSDGDFHPQIKFSPRVAGPVFGSGLLEAIPESQILAYADPDDADGDGISGRPNQVWDVLAKQVRLGRFGLKANQPSLLQQLASAYTGDMGLTNTLFPREPCTPGQRICQSQEPGVNQDTKDTDTPALNLALMEFYLRTLAVPQRRNANSASVLAGKRVFHALGCAACHRPSFETGELEGSRLGRVEGLWLHPEVEPVTAVSGQTIWPYSDLLLHDMGGDCEPIRREDASATACDAGPDCAWVQRCTGLADGRPDYLANGREWRTPPLWGIGLVKVVNRNAGFLHDGRARTLLEAILWHGGEAENSRRQFELSSPEERRALISFLMSL